MKVIKFFLGLILVILVTLWGGFVLMNLWNWFATPLGFIKISFGMALGIDCLVSYFKIHITKEDINNSDKTPNNTTYQQIALAIMYLMAYGIGAIIHAFIG